MNDFDEKINGLIRPNIRALKPYSSARDEFKTGSNGAQSADLIFLDANENSLGSPAGMDYSRYPDPQQGVLKSRIAVQKGIGTDRIFLGNGSDEAIDLLLRAFCEPGIDNIVLMPPTYGMYAVQANIHGTEIREAPLRPDFSPDAAAVKAVADARSKLLFICSPNNPTGQCMPGAFVLDMLENFPGLVVVDEAYIDFSREPSWIGRLEAFPRLVVLQTLSKAWGLAALRVGMAFAHPQVIATLNKIKYPYNIGAATIQATAQALLQQLDTQSKISTLLAERARLEAALPGLPCVRQVFPSDANFLLVRVTDADAIYRFLTGHNIVVRNRSREMHCDNCLRITVGSPAENDRLISALQQFPVSRQ
jgi:histidinol-phosphate aminotransferase